MNELRGNIYLGYGMAFAALLYYYHRGAEHGETLGDSIGITWPIFSFFGTIVFWALESILILLGVYPLSILEVYERIPLFLQYGWSFPFFLAANYFLLIRNNFGVQTLSYLRKKASKKYVYGLLLCYPMILIVSMVLVYFAA